MSVLQKLTEGVQSRDMQAEGAALLNKWEATGLLEGLNEGQAKQGMAVLLENQAKELLREATSMAAGDVEGFAAVAFPIVRRVFGGLIANDLVSVQPMSLPSGLIFFMDFVHSADSRKNAYVGQGESLYGGNVVGRQLTGGVDLDLSTSNVGQDSPGGFYEFNTGRSSATGSVSAADSAGIQFLSTPAIGTVVAGGKLISELTEAEKKIIDFDPDLLALGASDSTARILVLDAADHVDAGSESPLAGLNKDALAAIDLQRDSGGHIVVYDASDNDTHRLMGAATSEPVQLVRRLTKLRTVSGKEYLRITLVCGSTIKVDASGGQNGAGSAALALQNDDARDETREDVDNFGVTFPVADNLVAAGDPNGLGAIKGSSDAPGFALENETDMAEIDIKVDSIAVTAQTKKLKAKWSPELGQDLNAYHNLDAEVELTGILSEQIALEIDRELLGDLVKGATAGTRYWSRAPGLFVDSTGTELGASSAAPDFTGTVSEWYETLIETINDVSAQIHRKTLRGGANFVVCSPEVANILEFTSGFRASVTADQDRGTIGAVRAGSLSKKFDVYVDPYFLRNVILVGRKGSSFLESGFVYAPYVPLQVTPTIFGTEDFVPRKGVMTRYAKKMVRPDMYGLVVVRGLLGEQGAS
jgi:hypothetical protein